MSNAIKLKSNADIRHFFKANQTPLYYVAPTNSNLITIGDYVNNFNYITCVDTYNKQFPNLMAPTQQHNNHACECIATCTNQLLQNKAVINWIKHKGDAAKLIFLMFNAETEKLAQLNNFAIWGPAYSLFERLDSKTEIMPIIEKLQIPSVPNLIAEINDYSHLLTVSQALGNDLVLQSPVGDSGSTTFFIRNESDFKKYQHSIINCGPIKIMKRIKCHQFSIDACATRNGTIIGPLMTELIGFPELTPYAGGWSGNEVFKDIMEPTLRTKVYEYTQKLGDYLYNNEGFKGCFEIDFLLDIETNQLYFGELNPRVSGCGILTNQSHTADELPLFLYHLLEYFDVDFYTDVAKLNADWENPTAVNCYSLMIMKFPHQQSSNSINNNLNSGIWKLQNDQLVYSHFDYRINALKNPHEAFIIYMPKGNAGKPIARLIFPERAMDQKFQLTALSRQWAKQLEELIFLPEFA